MNSTTTTGHGHAHGHGAHHDDWDTQGNRLENEAEVSIGFLEDAAAWLAGLLDGQPVRRVLDIGSGPGVAACVLAAAFPDAEVVAVDGSAPLLERATARVARLGLGDRVTVAHQDLPAELDGLAPADVVWAARVVHHLGDQEDAVRRIGALVRPGGVLALAEGGLPMRFLPRDIGFGRPGIGVRLEAALEDLFSEMRAAQPDAVETVEHWPAILAAAGLTPAGTRSFLVDRPAPLDPAARTVMLDWWTSIGSRVADRVSTEDRRTLERLLDPDDEKSLHHREDAFVLWASTVHAGRAGRG
jgi:SAM-dependent methyltransferase